MTLKISSFNIRCYGFNGDYNGPSGKETRNTFLKKFIQETLEDSDVIFFQEIMDPDSFKALIPISHDVLTYSHPYKRHQFIMLSYKKIYTISDPYQNKHSIARVAINQNTSRPALYGALSLTLNSTPLIHLVGVHLKSESSHINTRLKQLEEIKFFIKELPESNPKILLGDFNSHKGDLPLMTKSLNEIQLRHAKNSTPTYHTAWKKEVLDHVYLSNHLKLQKLFVYDIQRYTSLSNPLKNINTYFKEISDHLPITVKISF